MEDQGNRNHTLMGGMIELSSWRCGCQFFSYLDWDFDFSSTIVEE